MADIFALSPGLADHADDLKLHFTDSKVLFAFAETEELLTERTDHYGEAMHMCLLYFNRKSHHPLDFFTSSHQRKLDQGNRTGA